MDGLFAYRTFKVHFWPRFFFQGFKFVDLFISFQTFLKWRRWRHSERKAHRKHRDRGWWWCFRLQTWLRKLPSNRYYQNSLRFQDRGSQTKHLHNICIYIYIPVGSPTQPPFFIGLVSEFHPSFSRDLSSSKRSCTIFLMVVNFQGIYI